MRSISMPVLLGAICGLAAGCGSGGKSEEQAPDPAFAAIAGCASDRLQDFGEFLHKGFVCLHAVDTNQDHPGCAWAPIPCTPDPGAAPPVTCPNGAGAFTYSVRFGTILARIRPGLWGSGPGFSECWNGMTKSESCAVEWHTAIPGSTVAASGDMGFVELAPDSHAFTLAQAEPVLEANGCQLRVTNLAVYVHLGNLELQQQTPRPLIIYSAQMGFEVSYQAMQLSGFAVFGDLGTSPLDVVFRGATRRCTFDAATFALACPP